MASTRERHRQSLRTLPKDADESFVLLSSFALCAQIADLPESDNAARTGYPLTTPLRTILDLAAANAISREALSKALLQIAERGLITRGQIKSARIPEVSRLQLEALLEWKKR